MYRRPPDVPLHNTVSLKSCMPLHILGSHDIERPNVEPSSWSPASVSANPTLHRFFPWNQVTYADLSISLFSAMITSYQASFQEL